MNKINKLLLLSLMSVPIFAMEPKRGIKRRASDEHQQISAMEIESVPAVSGFGILPSELKKKIFDYLITAPGITNDARLANAAANMRKFAAVNKDFRQYIKNYKTSGGTEVDVVGDLINGLAERYAPGNAAKAATIFGTCDAGTWLFDHFYGEENNSFKRNKKEDIHSEFRDVLEYGKTNKLKFLYHYLPFLLTQKYDRFRNIPRPKPASIAQNAESIAFFEELPQDVRHTIVSIIYNAFMQNIKGATNQTKLSNAVTRFIALLQEEENKKYVPIFSRIEIINFIVVILANQYTYGNLARAAMILGVAGDSILPIGEWFKDSKSKVINPLFLNAAHEGDTQCIDFLFKHNLCLRSSWVLPGFCPLVRAAENGHLSTVKKLIDLKITDMDEECTALISAACLGHTTVVQFLIQKGADVNFILENDDSHVRETALMTAAENGQEEIVRILLAAGAQTNVKDYEGSTALDLAQRSGHPNKEAIIKLLQEAPINN